VDSKAGPTFGFDTFFLREFIPVVLLKIRIMINTGHTQQFVLYFSTTYFGLKGHDPVEHKNKKIYRIHSLYGITIY
jgi:hypothetical protein